VTTFGNIRAAQYYCIKLESVIEVIRNVLGERFKQQEMMRCVKDSSFARTARAQFYDISHNPWPIIEIVRDDTNFTETRVPLPESKLEVDTLEWSSAVFFKKDAYDQIVNDVYEAAAVREQSNYKTIIITSANKEMGRYNLFDEITNGGWYGFRAIENTEFATYCGIGNQMTRELVCGMEGMIEGPIDAYFRPINLHNHYNYTHAPDNSYDGPLPAPLRICPFVFDNDDPRCLMPDDPSSKNYHNLLVDDYKDRPVTPKRGRDDELRSGGRDDQHSSPAGSTPLGSRSSGVSNTPLVNQIDDEQVKVRANCQRNEDLNPATINPFCSSRSSTI